ncbi:hypothetical protein ACKF11_15025 [Methylobacillus sp. Pita2]|uniref:hypothetical protein n=1 Tax=Methylobacillus sp. Pita2 TaxID=3383245 RepID=UPI0038B508AC
MSLLISALQKAEQAKQQPLEKAEIEEFLLDIAPAEPVHGGEASQPSAAAAASVPPVMEPAAQQRAAAQLLAARSGAAKRESLLSPFTQGLLLLLLVLLVGGGVFWYVSSLTQPEVIVPKPVVLNTAPDGSQQEQNIPEEAAAEPEVAEEPNNAPAQVEAIVSPAPVATSSRANTMQQQALPQVFGEPPKEPANSHVLVTRNRPAVTVNQHVLDAYQAFNRGDDAAAQQAYRQALQADVRNIDALLGMAAIAARQGRQQDAVGWYQQVLQVEPRNGMAQAALLDLQGQADPLNSETRLKNLISQQPEAAYLHAALGNHYADQGQWPLAQQSYFQAHHLDAANPEYVFNLAVSLDQLGKSSLALQYYQQAQALLAGKDSPSVNQAQLAARIRQLQ